MTIWLVVCLHRCYLFVLNPKVVDSEVLATCPSFSHTEWLFFPEDLGKQFFCYLSLKRTKNASITNTGANYRQSIGCFFFSFFISILWEKEDIGIHRKLGVIVFNSKGIVEGTSHSLKIMTNYAIFVLPN